MPTFNHLPFEIRAMIWKSTVEPRTVEVRVPPAEEGKVAHLVCLTPVPAPLQTCREARNLGLYKQAFSEVEEAVCPDGTEPRYVWVNLEIDIISIGPTLFRHFKPVALSIRLLQFARSMSNFTAAGRPIFLFEARELRDFSNAEDVYVECEDGLYRWYRFADRILWPCGQNNVIFIDPGGERVLGCPAMRQLAQKRLLGWMAGGMEGVGGLTEADRQLERERDERQDVGEYTRDGRVHRRVNAWVHGGRKSIERAIIVGRAALGRMNSSGHNERSLETANRSHD
ncbi:hypothetical protein V495_06648 [Pseudogymnoascus sp. VKM F-4514 (FW-929)]|nr:hypothetical protein V495_06648 [Pseudogymnoascus sp. VKM F-4514 (FW-929)]KFY57678.1 hypothetical protein V497_05320 [Pseudogymnoascus sp. VKM F-4516 (FW-969)]